MPLPWLARGLSLVMAEKSAVRSSTPTDGVPDELVVVLALSLSDPPPPQAAITKRAMPARPMVANHLHAERILPPSLALGRNCKQEYSRVSPHDARDPVRGDAGRRLPRLSGRRRGPRRRHGLPRLRGERRSHLGRARLGAAADEHDRVRAPHRPRPPWQRRLESQRSASDPRDPRRGPTYGARGDRVRGTGARRR